MLTLLRALLAAMDSQNAMLVAESAANTAMKVQKATNDQSVLWGHALSFWDAWGVRAMIFGAVLGISALAISLASSFILWRVAGLAQAELEGKTGGLEAQVAEQKARASGFEADSEKLKLQIVTAN